MGEVTTPQHTPQRDVALRILKAADRLMAAEGVQNLSTHKVAKVAGVSVGTIYLYFKDKEALLNQLVWYLFEIYCQYIKEAYDPSLPLFEQYQHLWHATWRFGQENPNVLQNFHQYQSLPSYRELMANCIDNDSLSWNQFIRRGQSQGVIINLDKHLLFALTMNVALEILRLQAVLAKDYTEQEIDEIIVRTWKAITI